MVPGADHEGQLVEPRATRIGLEEALRTRPAPRSTRARLADRAEHGRPGPEVAGIAQRRSSPGPGSPGSRPRLAQREGRLEPDHGVGIVGQGEQLVEQGRVASRCGSRPAWRTARGRRARGRSGRAISSSRSERPEHVERPEGVHPAEGGRPVAGEILEQRDGRRCRWRSISSRWAVSRHQASGSASRRDQLGGRWPRSSVGARCRVRARRGRGCRAGPGPCRWSGRGAS